MIRKTIWLSWEHCELLRLMAFEERRTESAILREALAKYFDPAEDGDP